MKTLNNIEISNVSGGSFVDDHKTELAVGAVVVAVVSIAALFCLCPAAGAAAIAPGYRVIADVAK